MKLKPRHITLFTLLICVWLMMIFTSLAEGYARGIYPFISRLLSTVSLPFSFSLSDCFIYGSIAGLIVYLVIAICRHKKFKKILLVEGEYLLWVYVWFYLAWGINYYRKDFYTRADVVKTEFSDVAFQKFLSVYADSLESTSCNIQRIDTVYLDRLVKESYSDLSTKYGILSPRTALHSKPMLLNRLMSGVGVLGYLGPFFNEYTLNKELLPVQYPFTYAHEMAHVLGVAEEAEANLYAYLICTNSSNRALRFSGYFGLLPSVLINIQGLYGKKAAKDWFATLSPSVKAVYHQDREYWDSRSYPLLNDFQDALYNLYLKGNNIDSGLDDYSEVIGMVMALRENN